jgi:hypothetical protein
MATSWAHALDAFESRLEAQRCALDVGQPGELAPFAPPAGLGPLPADLGERANELLRQSWDLEVELADSVRALSEDLAMVRAVVTSTARPSTPLFVDLSA